jgi:hypothetical protein
VTWSLCAHELPAWGNRRPWPRHWPTGVSYICLELVFSRQNRGWNLVCSVLIYFEYPHLRSSLFLAGLISGKHGCASATDGVIQSAGGGKCYCASVCSRGCRGSHPKVSLLKGELVEGRQARDVVGERVCRLLSSSAEGARQLMASKTEHREQFEELSLLWSWGVELCLSIIDPSQVMSPLPARMRAAALHYTRVVRELTTLWAAVSPAADLVLGCSPGETSRVEVMNELTAKFQEQEELCSRLKGRGARICSLLLAVVKCIYLPLTYQHFIQDIEDRCLLLTSSTSFVDLPFQEHRMTKKHHMDQNPCISSLCPK